MELRNLSQDSQNHQETYSQLYCTMEAVTGIRKELICFSVLHVFFSATALLGNTLIQIALHDKESSIHPPTKLLLRTLSATDLCVGLIAGPLIVIYYVSLLKEHWDLCHYALTSTFTVTYIVAPVSFLILTAIGLDRYLALSLGVRYRQVVTLKRTFVVVITFWVMCSIAAAMGFWDYHITLWFANINSAVCLLTSVISYTNIFHNLRQHAAQVQVFVHHAQPGQPITSLSPTNIARYRKAVSTSLWLQMTLVICYLPQGIIGVLWTYRGSEFSSSLYVARQIASILVFLNSSLNPILYCWKIREVRQAVKETMRQFSCYRT